MDLNRAFETDRLRFRILEMKDLEDVYKQFSDSEMCKYYSEPPCSMDEAREIIEHYQNPNGMGYLRYGMFKKDTHEFIGTCGYHYLDKEKNQVEIGYDIWKNFWREGYVSEALPVLIKLCFEYLKVDYIYILAHPENYASHASVRKFGFKECEPCRYEENQICMKLDRSDWIKAKCI